MKRIALITTFCCLIISKTYAQNNYQNIENFKAGTTLVFQNCSPDIFEPGESGKNVTWDFSNLKITNDTTTQWILAPNSVSESKDFPNATLVEKYANGSFVFLKAEKDKTYLLGFVDEHSKVNIKYPKPVLIAKRPSSFNDTITESYTTSYTINGMKFSGKGTATINVDGFGTLKLPNKTYEKCLRIKIIQKQLDILEQYNSTNEMTTTTYVWFDEQHNSALLKMTELKSQYHSENKIDYLLSETEN